MYDGQSLAVQLAPDRVAFENNGVDLDSDVFRIHGLTAAYVVVPALLIEGHTVTVDVAWVATGTPRRAVDRRYLQRQSGFDAGGAQSLGPGSG